MEDLNSLSVALKWAQEGKLGEWVHGYLRTAGRNEAFSLGLKRQKRYYVGPIRLALTLFERCCGPEDGMEFRVDRANFEIHVTGIQAAVRAGADLPPLIANYQAGGRFVLNDGNHRWEAMKRQGERRAWFVVWTSSVAERDEFWLRYGPQAGIGRKEDGL